ncbi:MAG TPA: M28 family peptidase [Gaiellaceae bacterium]|nr:M28 family peptidase [Gaiellaceae bacterium]
MVETPVPARRRRPRRGSLQRPLNARLYRSTFLVLSLPLLVLAFSVAHVAPLPAPQLPPAFDGRSATQLARDLATTAPDRVPGSAGALRAAAWFRQEMATYGLPVSSDRWRERVPGLGRVQLENEWAVAAGQSSDAIVVMAHRDDTGAGPGANDNASGTAALIELARGYAQLGPGNPERVRADHTVVFLSTDAGAFGALGAERFVRRLPFHVVAAINLDAIAGRGPPRLVIAGDAPRSPAASLVETAANRVLEQTGTRVRRTGFLGQLVDLALPFTLYEQGPFVARGIPAVTLTTANDRPPPPLGDRPDSLDAGHLAGLGRATQELLGSLDQGIELAQGTTSFVWAGDRIVRGWALELLLAGLLAPFLVAVVDLFARCRRRRIPLAPALRSLRTRLGLWLFAGAAFYLFGLAGAWGSGPARPPNPALPSSGDWPVLALVLLAAVVACGWLVDRHRLVPRRPVTAEERLAGETAALLALAVVSLLVLATNPFALLFVLPAVHAWLWLPQVRGGAPPARWLVFAAGLVGPLLVPLSFAYRFGLGFDAPWYVLHLVAIGYIHLPAVAITLGGGACAAQLVAVAAGRYAPYPDRRERPARGPLRELVRTVVLGTRARRRELEERRAVAP